MFKAKVRKYGDGRKIIEIPKCVRDEYKEGEELVIKKVEKNGNKIQ